MPRPIGSHNDWVNCDYVLTDAERRSVIAFMAKINDAVPNGDGKKIKLSLKMLSEWWGKAHFAVRVAGHKERIYER